MGDRLLVDIEKRVEGFQLAVQLRVETEVLVLFGPSGAGKTQTLSAIAGLVTPDRGEIHLDGETLFRRDATGQKVNRPTRDRRTAMVFQQYALFPHLTARENVAFPLRDRRNLSERVSELLGRLGLEKFAERYPHELSGGQQQRVAIARAVAAESRVLLLDEPFSALDRPTREQLHRELQSLQEETKLVILHVTHNIDDALVAGHRIAIINQGRIEQIGTADAIFSQPRSRNILQVLGVPNQVEFEVSGDFFEWKGVRLRIPQRDDTAARQYHVRQQVVGYIRPEHIRIGAAVAIKGSTDNLISGRVVSAQTTGLSRRVWIELPNREVIEALVHGEDSFSKGDLVPVSIPSEGLILVNDG